MPMNILSGVQKVLLKKVAIVPTLLKLNTAFWSVGEGQKFLMLYSDVAGLIMIGR